MAPKQITFGYNALDQITGISRYDFVGVGPMVDIATGAYSYDGANRLSGLAYTGSSGSIPIDSFTFTLDNANRITARNSTVDGEVDYGYDVTNQVTGANYTGMGQPPNEAYSYTKNGNRTNTGYQTGTNNQLLSDGTFNYQYDGEGNRTVRTRISNAQASDYKTTYSWDYRNRLTDVEFLNNSGVLTKHVHYAYDTFDHEIGKQVDDTGAGTYNRAEWYVLDVVAQPPSAGVPSTVLADPLLQFDQSGTLAYRYLNGPTPAGVDAVMAEEKVTTPGQAGSEYFPLGDQVNTPHEVVDVNSVVANHIVSNTFGVVASESNAAIHHWAGFGGGHIDPDTSMVNNYHRWYDPATGRWASEDPEDFAGGDFSLTRYVHNSVTSLTDRSGLQDAPMPTYNVVWPTTPSGQPAYGPPVAVPVQPQTPAPQIPPAQPGPQPWQTQPGVGGNWVFVPAAQPGWYNYPQPAQWQFFPTGPQIPSGPPTPPPFVNPWGPGPGNPSSTGGPVGPEPHAEPSYSLPPIIQPVPTGGGASPPGPLPIGGGGGGF